MTLDMGTFIVFLLTQLIAGVWWAATVSARLKTVEAGIIGKERMAFLEQTVKDIKERVDLHMQEDMKYHMAMIEKFRLHVERREVEE